MLSKSEERRMLKKFQRVYQMKSQKRRLRKVI